MVRKSGRLRRLSRKTRQRTDAELRDQELQLLQQTGIDWEALRPVVTGQDTYDRLAAAVAESTARNEDLAQLKARLQALGEGVWELARRVIRFGGLA